jgi:hypothetical protein
MGYRNLTVTGDSGTMQGINLTVYADNAANLCGSSVLFTNSGTSSTLSVTDSNRNTLIGNDAGTATVSGGFNTGLGYKALQTISSGQYNIGIGYNACGGVTTTNGSIAIGYNALPTTNVAYNIAIGTNTGTNASSGPNIMIGYAAGSNLSSGYGNILIGYSSGAGGAAVIAGNANVCLGDYTLYAGTSANSNTLIGYATGKALTSGSYNSILGLNAGTAILSGQENTLLGYAAGSTYAGAESNNICIGYNVVGTLSESNVIRLGNSSNTSCFIQGIEGVTVSNPNVVTINTSTGQMGSLAELTLALGGTNANLTASNGGIFYSTASAGAILAGTATANQVLLSGSSTTPAWSTATYPNTATTGDIIIATGTNALGSLADVAVHQVLVSGGVGAAPAYSAYPQISGLGIGASAGSTAGLTFDGTSFMSAYSTGTWTPTLQGASTGGTTTYGAATSGYYERIGNWVFVSGIVTWTGATGTGIILLGNLPYTANASASGSYYPGINMYSNVAIATATQYTALVIYNTKNVGIYGLIPATGTQVSSSLAANTNNFINFCGVYYAM